MGYDSSSKMRRLQEFWISKASAEQRKGRAGRTGPGVCFRLYASADYDALQDYATPEIHRVPLDSLVLQMVDLELGDPRTFAFIEPPSLSAINNSISFLKQQDALTNDELLTPIGQMLAKLPVDIVIGKMLVMGTLFNMVDPVLTIAAALSVQSPFHRLLKGGESAVQTKRRELESDHGDMFTLLNAFDSWVEAKAEGLKASRRWCRKYGLENQRFYEITKLKDQFKEILQEYHLLENEDEDSDSKHSSAKKRRTDYNERRKRRELKELKTKHIKEPRRRRVLKVEGEEDEGSSGEEAEQLDIRDLEFKLTHDLDKLQATTIMNRSFTLKDIDLLKIILCSGLYPQLAIADDCNTWRKDSEQVFHTQAKLFVVLHPTSVFATQPHILQPKIRDGEQPVPGRGPAKVQFNTSHEIIAYVDLLETTKPFVVNGIRVPALQTCLLFARSLDTNADCRRILVDGWLEMLFPESQIGQKTLSAVQQLRSTWNRLLGLRLKQVEHYKADIAHQSWKDRLADHEEVLARKLCEFLDSRIMYSLRRLPPSELEQIYIGPTDEGPSGADFVTSTCPQHPTKGGQVATDYLTYNCLSSGGFDSDYGGAVMRHWNCPRCNQSMVATIAERMRHDEECSSRQQKETEELEDAEYKRQQVVDTARSLASENLRKSYHCSVCDKEFMFTFTEILKHARTHTNSGLNKTD
ncbi:probable ATP-dependent RNA helicase DHX34 [Corticium candelabrum]|uniref:probable ATP-dependent RNA helicase DHX34 n=1 Tax=Corticium candelabrum TaxID=121492 RepID=UPI002E261C32|nr:probable ATP-dependent RNA helicase DHX34 [Corticium candelabrum]